ncbi:S1 RNA-binding domain-containing protein [[Mycoplasma] falconis]|uniref:S1 RNA-binding domain-containing protein n=1 Tax=[Mycoplasma] falconis TaxID=92403 RepID=A0A501XB24_9BACT|nr:Tex-like N-terminal domain-containing protein [[Mycoplasma] falconis]TPE57751.1 S1 RNA-binding domain-containing protein [[Mycoplasma] falconis]
MNTSIQTVAKRLNIKENQVETVLSLLNEGATIPFISRYRKDATGGLDEDQITKINEYYQYDVELVKRKDYILEVLAEKKLLTDELKNKILNSITKQEVENIYEPFKVGKKTKASEAIALGLEPLAKNILNNTDEKYNPIADAKQYLSDKLQTLEEVLEQAKYIIAQEISQQPQIREYIKDNIIKYGKVISSLKKGAEDEKEVFKQYYQYEEKITKIPNHRVLALNRGSDLKILNYDLDFRKEPIFYELKNKLFKNKRTAKIVNEALEDALERLLYPSIIREIKTDLFTKAEAEAIEVFAENLEQMLLWPATKNKWIMSIDPAFVNGCKLAILDPNGNFIEKGIIYPHTHSKENYTEAYKTIEGFLNKYKIDLIVIGNGTASRETENFISKIINNRKSTHPNEKIGYAIVSEVGASVYSASKLAQEEFPNLHVEERSAINIGRRFQDPLNELIKIDPKSLGVGQYQHDVNQKELAKQLEFKVNKVVNLVGVDLNSATPIILSYISGLSLTMAKNIVAYRQENGKFTNRKQLKKVKGIGDKAYEQAVGFLRIHDSNVFYDKTNIHPESYDLADQIVKYLKIDLNNIDKEKLEKINREQLSQELDINKYDIDLILDSLIAPEKDIRDDKDGFIISDKVLTIDDIATGQVLTGQVQNITDFGAFVFIGLKQAALVHITNMKKKDGKYIKHPLEVVNVGDNVKLEIIDIDKQRERIQGKIIWE